MVVESMLTRDRPASPRFAPLRGFRDQALQEGFEDTGVPPLPEAVADRPPGTELLRHLPPLPADPEAPDHALELLPQPLGVRAVPTDRQVRLDEPPLRVRKLHSRHKTIYRIRPRNEGESID